MATPFFNKKEDPFTAPRQVNPNAAALGAAQQQAATSHAAAPVAQPATVAKEGESKLTVGPNIKLKGVEITDCDTLVVEGSVEATMDSRVIQISERGSFKGSAEIDIAEIRGEFDGTLTVRQKLVIYATGKVTGKIRYGKVVIEEGGQLSGEIEYGAAQAKLPIATPVRPGLQVHSTVG
jgi:cytoskeletal protein CcmA (bactofilin family)